MRYLERTWGGALIMPRLPALSNRAQALKPSLTLEISARAKELRQQGQDIAASVQRADFDTPKFIVEAAQRALLMA